MVKKNRIKIDELEVVRKGRRKLSKIDKNIPSSADIALGNWGVIRFS